MDNSGRWISGPQLPQDRIQKIVALNDEGTVHMIFKETIVTGLTWTFDWLGTREWEASGTILGRVDFAVTRTRVLSGSKHVVIVAGGMRNFVMVPNLDLYDMMPNSGILLF